MTTTPDLKPYVKPHPEPSANTTIRLTVDTLNQVHVLCEQTGRHKSDILRECIEVGLPLVRGDGDGDAYADLLSALKATVAYPGSPDALRIQAQAAIAKATGAAND